MAKKKKSLASLDDELLAAGVVVGESSDVRVTSSGMIIGDNSANDITVRSGNNKIKARGGHDKVTSGSGNDQVWGDRGNDKIYAGNGKNSVEGGSGKDLIKTGKSKDKISGESGNDKIYAGSGADKIYAGSGTNQVKAGGGNDLIKGGNGRDKVWGGAGNDKIYVANGNNWVDGGNGADHITAGNGNDTINGGSGDDYIVAGLGDNTIDGGTGVDTVVISGSVFDYDFTVTSLADLKIEHVSSSRVDKIKNAEILEFDDGNIYLDGRNNAPIAKDIAVNINDNSPALTINLLTASDAFDLEGTLQVTGVTPNGTVLGSVGFDALSNELTYDTEFVFSNLNSGQTAQESVDFTISDGTTTITRTVTFTIAGTAYSLPIAADDTFTTDENTTLVGDLFADNGAGVDSDADGDNFTVIEVDGLPVNGTQITLSSGALLTVGADGMFSYNSNDVFDFLNVGQSANDSFTYTIGDSSGGTSTATVSITIDGALNTAPIAVDDTFQVVEGQIGTFAPLANDSDPENDGFSIVAIDGQAISGGQTHVFADTSFVTLNSDGTITFDQNGQFDLAPGDPPDEVNFSYDVQDTNGNIASATISIQISADAAPFVVDDAPSVFENQTVTFAPLANDSDLEGESLTIIAVDGIPINPDDTISITSGALVTLNPDGTLTYDPSLSQQALNDLQPGQTIHDLFSYDVSDSVGNISQGTIDVSVNGSEGPVAVDDTAQVAALGTVAIDVLDNDTDPEGDTLIVTSINGQAFVDGTVTLANGATVTLDLDGDLIYDASGSASAPPDSFQYEITDGAGNFASATVTIDLLVV